jgi:hypothetical protein
LIADLGGFIEPDGRAGVEVLQGLEATALE